MKTIISIIFLLMTTSIVNAQDKSLYDFKVQDIDGKELLTGFLKILMMATFFLAL